MGEKFDTEKKNDSVEKIFINFENYVVNKYFKFAKKKKWTADYLKNNTDELANNILSNLTNYLNEFVPGSDDFQMQFNCASDEFTKKIIDEVIKKLKQDEEGQKNTESCCYKTLYKIAEFISEGF